MVSARTCAHMWPAVTAPVRSPTTLLSTAALVSLLKVTVTFKPEEAPATDVHAIAVLLSMVQSASNSVPVGPYRTSTVAVLWLSAVPCHIAQSCACIDLSGVERCARRARADVSGHISTCPRTDIRRTDARAQH